MQMQTVGQCGTLLGTNMFPAGEKPYYRKGMWIGFSFSMLAAVGAATLSYLFWRENKRRDRVYGKASVTGHRVEVEDTSVPVEANLRYII